MTFRSRKVLGLSSGIALLLSACITATSNMDGMTSPAELPGYTQSYDNVFSAAVDVVTLLSWEIKLAQKDAGLISAETPETFMGGLDKVTVRVFQSDSTQADRLVRVGFTSGTAGATDWGKGAQNQQKFFEKLNARLGTPSGGAKTR